ncbi:hypothetical protein FOA52_001388 [Chlamydomonas sp. UWO 241]|nr:hypothetical protein FOA52_001388 [Chlamydomonas sp. UWO 241]
MIAACNGVYVALKGEVARLYEAGLKVCGDNANVVLAACEWGHHDILRYALHIMPQPGAETEFVAEDDDDDTDEEVDATEDYFESQVDCRRIISRAVYSAIVGGHVECVRLVLAFARPWLSTVAYRRAYILPVWIDFHIDMLLLYCKLPYHSLYINPAIMQVINAEVKMIEALDDERKELKSRNVLKERKERKERRELAARLKELNELKELEKYAAEVAEFWF